jgi:hypothetical protein
MTSHLRKSSAQGHACREHTHTGTHTAHSIVHRDPHVSWCPLACGCESGCGYACDGEGPGAVLTCVCDAVRATKSETRNPEPESRNPKQREFSEGQNTGKRAPPGVGSSSNSSKHAGMGACSAVRPSSWGCSGTLLDAQTPDEIAFMAQQLPGLVPAAGAGNTHARTVCARVRKDANRNTRACER